MAYRHTRRRIYGPYRRPGPRLLRSGCLHHHTQACARFVARQGSRRNGSRRALRPRFQRLFLQRGDGRRIRCPRLRLLCRRPAALRPLAAQRAARIRCPQSRRIFPRHRFGARSHQSRRLPASHRTDGPQHRRPYLRLLHPLPPRCARRRPRAQLPLPRLEFRLEGTPHTHHLLGGTHRPGAENSAGNVAGLRRKPPKGPPRPLDLPHRLENASVARRDGRMDSRHHTGTESPSRRPRRHQDSHTSDVFRP